MKKLLIISFCIANFLNANSDEQALELWRKNALKSIEATQKLQKPLVNYYDQLQSNKKPQTLNELKNTAQNKHDYFKNLTTSEFKKSIGKQVLKNGAITGVATSVGLVTLPLLGVSSLFFPFVTMSLPDYLFNSDKPLFFHPKELLSINSLVAVTGSTISIISFLTSLKYGKKALNNIGGLINTEQKLFDKKTMSNYNLQKLEKLQKTISNKDL